MGASWWIGGSTCIPREAPHTTAFLYLPSRPADAALATDALRDTARTSNLGPAMLKMLIPPWNGLHPLVIHFPIVLLLVAALFVLAAAIRGERGETCRNCALVLMVLGTAGAFLAVATGQAAAQIATGSPGFEDMISDHAESAEDVRLIFSILTAVWAVIVLVPGRLWAPVLVRWRPVAQWVFFAFYATGTYTVARTAHLGGHLVNEFGIRAPMD
jgi:uncharacterized membrane protein